MKPGAANEVAVEAALELAGRMRWDLHVVSMLAPERVPPTDAVPMGGEAYQAHRDELPVGNRSVR